MSAYPGGVDLLPGIVHPDISDITGLHQPVASSGNGVVLGYFGGLTQEKGAGLLIEMLPHLPEGTVLRVTGSGPLSDDLGRAMARHPGRLIFHGRVESAEMVRIMAACDVIINPHMPIVDMANGVFPFKLIESVASGRLLISTDVMKDGLEDVLGGVLFCESNVRSLLDAVVRAKLFYQQNEATIVRCSQVAVQRFGLASVRQKVVRVLAGPQVLPGATEMSGSDRSRPSSSGQHR
jgi:glycosyltransferase involved in cell wall biosynthesis